MSSHVGTHSASRIESRVEGPAEELARSLDDAESHRLRALSFDDLRRIARLYRGESARLARLRDRGGDLDRIDQLNSLCVRAHAFLYSARSRRGRAQTARHLFVSALSSTARLQALAWGVMAIGTSIGFSLVVLDPTSLYALLPASLGYDVTQIDSLYRSAEARDVFLARESAAAAQNALFGSYLFANNTRVGILAFASGILFGLPTILLQLYNGIMIGSISALFLRGGHAIDYLAWLLPHGIPELTAITLCCTAGFVLGRAVASPGPASRPEALRRAGPTALALFLTSVPLFFAAAWIESFVRESALGLAPRFTIATLGLTVLVAASLMLRRLRKDEPESLDWLDALIRDPAGSASLQASPRSLRP